MSPIVVDSEVSRLAAEGQFALGIGDTDLASAKFSEAADRLESAAKESRVSADREYNPSRTLDRGS